jgi:PAS domain S-box-containing protein
MATGMAAEPNLDPLFVLAPFGRDAQVIEGMLRDAGLRAQVIESFAPNDPPLEDGAGLIVAEEAFARLDPAPLLDWLRQQPPWSDFPIVLLRMRNAPVTPETVAFIESLGKVTILERPLHPITLVAASRSAIRVRNRQREAEAFLIERTRAADSLRESEARFRALADSAPALIWMTNEAGEFVYANRGHEIFFGRPAASFLGDGWREVLHPEDATRVIAAFERSAADRTSMQIEFRVEDAAGATRWLRCEAEPRAVDGHVGQVGCSVDITDARLAADQLERRIEVRTAELAAANRQLVAQMEERERMETTLRRVQRLEAVGQLTAGVAHDFNNLLSVVMGSVDFLERTAGPAEKRRLNLMRIAAERGAKLTSQLLTFSRRQKLEPKVVDLNEAVLSLRDLLQSTIGRGYELTTKLEPDPWPALVDPTQIEMVILNLAINARDAMEVGGRLAVETANVTVTAPRERPEEPEPGDYLMVAVSDTGSGMPPEVLERVFEPFYTTKPAGKGSGLGLSQVLGFAKQSGGGVRIETESGKGTSVQVFLPRAREKRADPRPPLPQGEASFAGPRGLILLVDDDDMVRENTALMLRDLGFSVLQAGSGAAALEILEDGRALDLLMVDFAMPGMNGAEVAKAAAAKRPRLPILYVTGYAELDALSEIDKRRLLTKPFDERALAERLREALEPLAQASI